MPSEDALKFWGNEENVAIIRNGSYLSFEARPVPGLYDTTYLYLNRMIAGTTYNFAITGANLPAGTTGYLIDKYLSKQTVLNLAGANNISFYVDTAAASKSASRFMIVFSNKSPLSVTGMQIKARIKDEAAVIDWSVVSEKNVDHYIVERSTDAKTFVSIATQVSNNVNNSFYSYNDNKATVGVNYYRIKAISKDGTAQYSTIAKVTIGDGKEGISIYPNPVTDNHFSIQLTNLAAGSFIATLYNTQGAAVADWTIAHAGGSATQTLNIDKDLAEGIYILKFTGAAVEYHTRLIKNK